MGEKTQKSRTSRSASDEGVGDEGILTKSPNLPGHETNTKRSQIAFAVTSIALAVTSIVLSLVWGGYDW